MADKRRFDLFAEWVVGRWPDRPRVFDVAGGMGKLNVALTSKGRQVTTFDRRERNCEPVTYARRDFTVEEPLGCDVVLGMHPDGATRVIIQYAARHHIPFAVVPCCADNGMPYNPWMKHLTALAQELGFARVGEETLKMDGRARVLWGDW